MRDFNGSIEAMIESVKVRHAAIEQSAHLMTNILTDLIPCSSLNDGSIFGSIAQGACDSADGAVVQDIDYAINNIPLGIGICSVQASVPTSQTELKGNWQGSVSGTPFNGTLDAVNNN